MLDIVQRFHHFGLRVTDAHHVVEATLNGDKNVLVNSGAQGTAAMFVKKRWEVCAATEKTDTERGLYDDHEFSKRRALSAQPVLSVR